MLGRGRHLLQLIEAHGRKGTGLTAGGGWLIPGRCFRLRGGRRRRRWLVCGRSRRFLGLVEAHAREGPRFVSGGGWLVPRGGLGCCGGRGRGGRRPPPP